MRFAFAIVAGTILALGAPASAQPVPATSPALGYSEEQIGPDRFRVRVGGEQFTSGEAVERYLLYRAAQLTLTRGFDSLARVNRDPAAGSQRYVARCYDCVIWRDWRADWRWLDPAKGWRSYDPFADYPDIDRVAITVTQYEASADFIVMPNPRAPTAYAFDARWVVEQLGPKIEVPK